MTKHLHLLLTPTIEGGVPKLMQSVGRRYAPYFNRQYRHSRTLWEGRFRACLVQSEQYFLECYRYIELNPVRAAMVATPGDYKWSSYRVNALGIDTKLVTPHSEYLARAENLAQRLTSYRSLFIEQIDPDWLTQIRTSTRKGLVIGSQQLADRIAVLTKQWTSPGCVGRPNKSKGGN